MDIDDQELFCLASSVDKRISGGKAFLYLLGPNNRPSSISPVLSGLKECFSHETAGLVLDRIPIPRHFLITYKVFMSHLDWVRVALKRKRSLLVNIGQ